MRTILGLLVFAAPLAFAQNAQNDLAAKAAAFQNAQALAATNAARPGDAALTCEQLQTEFAALAQTPNFQTFVAQQGAVNAQGLALANQATAGLTLPPAVPEAAALQEQPKKKGGFLKKMGGIGAGLAGGLGGGRGGTEAVAANVAADVIGGGDVSGAVAGAVATQAVTGAVQGSVNQAVTSTALSALGGGLLGGRAGGAAGLAQLAAGAGGLGGNGGGLATAVQAAQVAQIATGTQGNPLGAGLPLAQTAQLQNAATQFAGAQLGQITAIAPELMRGMHLVELARGHTCPWVQGL